MRHPDRLPEGALNALLDGSPSQEAVGTPLAEYLAAIRHDAVTTEPRPSEALGAVLAEGLDPAELAAQQGSRTPSDARGILPWRLRGRTALRLLATKFAALGLLAKTAAAGAAVTVAASGAGAVGVLPPPAQTTFDDVIGREAPATIGGDEAERGTDGTDGADVAPVTPGDTSTTEPLESDVSDDATGSSDDERGVDGGEVAGDASDGASDAGQAPSDAPTRGAEAPGRLDDAPEGADDAPDGADDAPSAADDAPDRADDAPDRADDAPDGEQTTAEQGDVSERPDASETSPSAGRGGDA